MEAYFTENFEAVIFDFEGTLVDFQWKLSEAIEEALEKLYEMGFARTQIRSRKYSTLLTEAMHVAPEIGIQPADVGDAIGNIYDSYDEDALTRWNLRPGVKDFLQALKIRGIQTALVSNIGGKTLAKALSVFGLEALFDITLSRNDVPNLKPRPDGINLALHRMGVSKERSIFLGDSLDDVNAARNADIKVMIITNGENLKSEILAARPHRVFETYEELCRTM
ncbi:MAG: HAD family phosphatase [Syntrophobacteraceae bacterium]